MLTVHSYADTNLVNSKAYIQHPLADEISIAIGDGAMASFPYTVELAFFKNGDWVSDILPEFAAYADGPAAETLVYCYVPLDVFANFLKAWRVQ